MASYTEFYVTKGSAVSDVNGGGPSLGTNDGPVDTEANCSSDGAGTSITNDDADGWTNSSVDDWICFDTAGTKDFARITNIAGDVLTVTPAVALGAASKNVNVGGAWATIDFAVSTVTLSFVNAAGDFPRVNVKYDAVAYTESVTLDNDGSTTVPWTLEGYETSVGDLSANRPQITGVFTLSSRVHVRVLNFTVVSAAATAVVAAGLNYSTVQNIHSTASGATSDGFSVSGTEGFWFNCHAKDAGRDGWNIVSITDVSFTDCTAFGATRYGFLHNARGPVYVRLIAGNNGDDGVYIQDEGALFTNGTFYGNGNAATGSGARVDDAVDTKQSLFVGCLFFDNNKDDIEIDAAGSRTMAINCAFETANSNTNLEFNIDPIGLSGDPFTDGPNGDFSLDNTAGEGAACRGTGFPGTGANGTSTGYLDVGAIQHQDAGGGGGAVRSPIGMTGGMQ